VQLAGGESELAEVVRALDQAGIAVATLHLHAPSLDDVFLAETGHKLEGATDDDAAAPGGRRRRRRAA
jgi:hypothetical protein